MKKGLRLAVAFVLLAAIFYTADVEKIAREILRTDPAFYFAAAAVFMSTHLAAGVRWRNLSRSIGETLSVWQGFRMIAVSYGFNVVFPGNAGDLGRSKLQERYVDVESHGRILGIVAVERFLDFVGVTVVTLVSLYLIASRFSQQAGAVIALIGGITVAGGMVLYLRPSLMERTVKLAPERFQDFGLDVVEGAKSSSRAQLLENLVLTLYVWFAEAVAFYLLVLSLDMEAVGFWEGAFTTSMMSLSSVIPISPGGLGVVEAVGTGFATLAGAEYAAAVSLVILQRSLSLVMVGLVAFTIYQLEELEIIGEI